jgi:hypothetical protein
MRSKAVQRPPQPQRRASAQGGVSENGTCLSGGPESREKVILLVLSKPQIIARVAHIEPLFIAATHRSSLSYRESTGRLRAVSVENQ